MFYDSVIYCLLHSELQKTFFISVFEEYLKVSLICITSNIQTRGGAGVGCNGCNCGTNVRTSMLKLKPTPIIQHGIRKNTSSYTLIYLIIQNIDLFIYCPLIFL